MQREFRKLFIPILSLLWLSACASTGGLTYQERTVAQGAMIGATAGAVLGSQNDKTAEGAVIGGVVGALAGAVLAQQRDQPVYTSKPRYHRRACHGGAKYFDRAHHAHHLDGKIHLLKQGLRYCPNNPAAHNDLGVALSLRGKHRVARTHFHHALRLDPHYLPAQRNLARLKKGRHHHYASPHKRGQDKKKRKGRGHHDDDDD